MTNSRQCSGVTVLSTCPSGDAPYYTVVTLLRLNLGISIERWMILTTPRCIAITIPEVHVALHRVMPQYFSADKKYIIAETAIFCFCAGNNFGCIDTWHK